MNPHQAHILVTGGAGLIGSHTIDLLLQDQPAQITVLDNYVRGTDANLAQALASGKVHVVRGDITDPATVRRCMDGVDAVFHLAAIRITQCAQEPRLAHDVLATGTFNVLEAAAAAGVKKVVAASSASVYGLADHFPTTERQHPYDNRTLYGAAKAYNEGLLRSFNDMTGLPYVALRYFNVYGPRMDIHGAYTEVLIRWMERLAAGQPPLILGDGAQTMDFIHVTDIARANVAALKADVSDEVFNIARGEETSLLDLARSLMKVMEVNLPPEFGPARKVNPVSRRLADVTAARDRLGFSARISLEEGLRSLVGWWRAQRIPHP
jgi:UDP-glucose 4-epimerase